MTEATDGERKSRRGTRRLIGIGVLVALGLAALMIGPIWAQTLFEQYVPRSIQRGSAIGFLFALVVAHLVGLVLAFVGVAWSVRAILRARRRGLPRTRPARLLALCVSVLLGLGLMEAGASAWLAHEHRLIALPTRFPEKGPEGEIYLVVIGESSAKGVPYDPNLSVGQVVGWGLEKAFPGRKVKAEMLAYGGCCLEQAIIELLKVRRKPDAILLYSGHNEFQARFGWSRDVRHYVEEEPEHNRSAVTERLERVSPLCRFILETIDHQRVDAPPPPKVTRELVDHPCVSPEGYAYLRDDFARRLEGLASYCDRIGAVPIMIVPPSNDGRSPPNRSILPSETTKAARDAFARSFRAAEALAASDAPAAESAYRRLLEQQPGFAEAHYRLARLLERSGRWDEAKRHDILARDLDAFPMRCPSDFRAAYFALARRHPSLVLIDAPRLLEGLSAHGILTFHQFHDAHHPTFRSYLALAQEVLERLRQRHSFGWPGDREAPRLDPDEAAARFGLDARKWAAVMDRAASFYAITAYIRYEPRQALDRANRMIVASRAIASGTSPEETGIPGVGVHPLEEGDGSVGVDVSMP